MVFLTVRRSVITNMGNATILPGKYDNKPRQRRAGSLHFRRIWGMAKRIET